MILGLMGQAGSGKDTMADFLVSKYGFVKVGLADPLKRICKMVFDFSDDQLYGDSGKRNEEDKRYLLSPRVALQTLGTEWGRSLYNNTWIDYGLRIATQLLTDHNCRYSQKDGLKWSQAKELPFGVVISDIRFRNEMEAVLSKDGHIIRLRREGVNGGVGIQGHASEEEQKTIQDSEVSHVIHVPEGIPLFHKKIEELMSVFQKGKKHDAGLETAS